MRRLFVFAGLALLGFCDLHSARAASMKELTRFDLPGDPGKRFDYLTIDPGRHALLSAHLGAGLLDVIDLRTNQLIKSIPDLPGIEGVEYAPDLDKVYASDWKEQKIAVIDMKTMTIIKKLPAEAKPDGSAYALPHQKIYVSDERAKALIVIDAVKDEIIKTLRFESETGMPQYDPVSDRVYLNLQDQNLFAVIDPSKDELIGTYPVGDCQGNHGMALDSANRRAFLACESNNQVTVLDLEQMKPLASISVPEGVDVIKFDAGLGRLYAACYSGAISVIQQQDSEHYVKLEDFPVQAKVHSLAVDPDTHRVYAPEQEEDGRPVSRMVVYEAVGNP